jgi:hypothetical protein
MSYLLYAFLIILSPVIIPLFILLLPWSRRLTKLYLDNRIKASLQSSLETTTLQSGNIVLAANAKLFYWLKKRAKISNHFYEKLRYKISVGLC